MVAITNFEYLRVIAQFDSLINEDWAYKCHAQFPWCMTIDQREMFYNVIHCTETLDEWSGKPEALCHKLSNVQRIEVATNFTIT